MAYTVLARKYRPQTFADLVGQEHVTRTLENAIRSERVAHAFLFTGVRGVGKTTTARLLAKALNCEKGPTPTPCGECDICVSITAGRDTDVLEMDGASNNSVEDVRRLQESIPYRPQRDRFKIVIVDEVHMLSIGAFNAFLKTLEEPPEHVKFIFATTEAHKVPVTIRSRCQRYDFRLIPESVVSQRVREILDAEKVTADDATVSIVSREAAGSMRDALTLLDQIMAFGGTNLAGDEVAKVLGIAGRGAIHSVAGSLLEGNGGDALRLIDQLATNGLDMLHFARQLLDLIRDMVVLQVSGRETELVGLVDEERERAFAAGEQVDLQELQRLFSGLSRTVEDVAQSGTPRTTLEMGLVRLATRPPLLPLTELVARLDDLERRAGGGQGGGRQGGAGGSRGGGRGRGQGDGRPSESVAKKTARASSPPAAKTATPREPARSPRGAPEKTTHEPPAEAKTPEPKPTEEVSVEVSVEAPSPLAPSGGWEEIVSAVMESKPALGAVLQHGLPASVTPERIALRFTPGSFFGRQAEQAEAKAALAETAEKILGRRPEVEIVYGDARSGDAKTIVEADTDLRKERNAEIERQALNHPIVRQAQELFSLPKESMTVRIETE